MNGTTFPPSEFSDDAFADKGSYGGNQGGYQQRQNDNQGGQNSSYGGNRQNDNQGSDQSNSHQGGGNQGGYQGGGGYKGGGYQGGGGSKGGGGGYQGGQSRSYGGGGGSGGGGGGFQRKPYGGGGQSAYQKRPEDSDMTLYKPYAFTSNEEVPPEIKSKLIDMVKLLENNGYTLRTGGMEGMEEMIENSVTKKEIHLPWREFNGKQSRFTFNSDRAYAVAKKYHPTFDGLSKGVKCFLAKNARLVLGNNMTSPALFLLTWTEDGATSSRDRTARTGFAGHAIAIAAGVGIPVINLARSDAEQKLNMLMTNEM